MAVSLVSSFPLADVLSQQLWPSRRRQAAENVLDPGDNEVGAIYSMSSFICACELCVVNESQLAVFAQPRPS